MAICLIGQLPTNPFHGDNGELANSSSLTSADVDTSAMQGTVKVGWIDSTVTGQFMANSTETVASRVALSAL